MKLTEEDKERIGKRFFKYVKKGKRSDCWIWTGYHNVDGYGDFGIGTNVYKTHRVSLAIHSGFDLNSKWCVLHNCNNPACVNPNHLRLGTNFDNMQDRLKAGHYSNKLTEKQARQIFSLFEKGITQDQLAKRFKMNPSSINLILGGTNWKYLGLKKPILSSEAREKAWMNKHLRMKGASHPLSKLTEEMVRSIHRCAKNDEYLQDIARKFNVKHSTVWGIVSGKSWRHLKLPKLSIGGHRIGVENKATHLTEKEVIEIHNLAFNRVPRRIIAERYGLKSHRTVNCIANGEMWKHLGLIPLTEYECKR